MSGGMPELGSKISLISKADIRYEGRLFTVDPQECTIALANGESQIKMDTEISFAAALFPGYFVLIFITFYSPITFIFLLLSLFLCIVYGNLTIFIYLLYSKMLLEQSVLDSSGKASIQNNRGHPSFITGVLCIICNLNIYILKLISSFNVFLVFNKYVKYLYSILKFIATYTPHKEVIKTEIYQIILFKIIYFYFRFRSTILVYENCISYLCI